MKAARGGRPAGRPGGDEPEPDVAALTASEIRQLRVRMIALENVVIAMIATGSEAQLDLTREMAAFIFPRPGFTPPHDDSRGRPHERSCRSRRTLLLSGVGAAGAPALSRLARVGHSGRHILRADPATSRASRPSQLRFEMAQGIKGSASWSTEACGR